eukprot:12887243-Prorocentrum_lima.AAC.1
MKDCPVCQETFGPSVMHHLRKGHKLPAHHCSQGPKSRSKYVCPPWVLPFNEKSDAPKGILRPIDTIPVVGHWEEPLDFRLSSCNLTREESASMNLGSQ